MAEIGRTHPTESESLKPTHHYQLEEMPQLSLAVCIFPIVCPTDFQGPVELLSFIDPETVARGGLLPSVPDTTIKVTFVGVTSDPVKGSSGPKLQPDRTYSDIKEGEQFDIILVPGGWFDQCRDFP